MTLKEYGKKRGSNSGEPQAKESQGQFAGSFVVQKHQARRLHYDFRLELNGVLKSWAVPKGPSLNPKDKRLAMMVEDHPLEYRSFEGEIPRGHYGAGQVIVWDKGTYLAVGARDNKESALLMRDGLDRGKISFVLNGEKLMGEFTLTKIKTDEPNSWLLIKKKDEFASDVDVTKEDSSVKSGRSIENIEIQALQDRVGELKVKMPTNIRPMLARLADKPFDKAGWGFEVKLDGYRAIAEVDNGYVNLCSRSGQSYNKVFSDIFKELKDIHHQAILDGEIVVLLNGKPKFDLLQNYAKKGEGELKYYIFDLLYLDGYDLRPLPLKDRRALLEALCARIKTCKIKLSPMVMETGVNFFRDFIVKNDLEGALAKKLNSPYKAGERSGDWLKIKNHKTEDVIIAGFTEGRGGRRLGALVLGTNVFGRLKYIGHVGTGFSDAAEDNLLHILNKIKTSESPFSERAPVNAPVTWVKPQLVANVRYSEWTKDGILRHAVFLGLRTDKLVDEVAKEKAESYTRQINLISDSGKKEKIIDVDGYPLTVSNYKKKYWPEGYTKMDLINYYLSVAPYILPHLRDRPESLHRFPNGIKGESFYQKNTSELNLPEPVETVLIKDESGEDETLYILCQNAYTLAYLINLGCIELNPWISRVGALDNPDYLVIDLDPLNVSFEKVLEVARIGCRILSDLNIKSYIKTSGATGLHIYIPLGAKYSYEQARMFAEVLANLIFQKTTPLTSLERNPEKRKRKIYIDYLQNRKGQTVASVYSVRPIPGASVSTPLTKQELGFLIDPKNFDIKNSLKRLHEKGDLWAPIESVENDLLKIMNNIHER